MNMKPILCLALLLHLALSIQAQQDPTYSQYLFNKLVLNPAYAGSTGEMSVRLMSRFQWVGFDNAPRTHTFAAHMPTPDHRHGVGLNLVADALGHTRSLLFTATYAYRIPVGEGHLGLGLDLGIKSLNVNYTDLALQDPDPIFGQNLVKVTHVVAGTGIYYQNDLLYAGVSMPDILPHKLGALYAGSIGEGKTPMNVYLMGGAAIPVGEAVKVRPSVLVRVTPGLPLGLDLGLAAMLKDRILAGAIWRPSNALVLHVQGYLAPRLQIGYAYDLSLRDIGNYTSGSHEIMLGIDIDVHQADHDPPIRF